MNRTHVISPEPTDAEIRHAAYCRWRENGRSPGHDVENWFAAKEFLLHRLGPAGGPVRRAPARPVGARREATNS